VPFEEETSERFEESLRVYVGGARNFAAECMKWMLAQGEAPREGAAMEKRGTLIFTGTLGALRTNAHYAAYGAGRAGVRMLAQSLARELGPKGVHVAHVVIDGAIDGAFIRGLMPDAAERLAREEILVPDEIAKNYVWLYRQKRSAWTFEMDLRPWSETW